MLKRMTYEPYKATSRLGTSKGGSSSLSKKLSESAFQVYESLSKKFAVEYDESGSIGKRYRRFDEIGTPFCITFDFDSLEDNCVTVRYRDSMEQERIAIDSLENWLAEKLVY